MVPKKENGFEKIYREKAYKNYPANKHAYPKNYREKKFENKKFGESPQFLMHADCQR